MINPMTRQRVREAPADKQQALSIVNGVLENVRVAFVEKKPDNLSRVLSEVISTDESSLLRSDTLKNELAKLFAPKVTGGAVGAVQVFYVAPVLMHVRFNSLVMYL